MESTTVGPITCTIDRSFAPDIYVHIEIGGEYWDTKTFYCEADAQAFLRDPLKECRPKPDKPEQIDTRFLDYHSPVHIYKQAHGIGS